MTVNHDVTGSSPVGGATRERPQQRAFFLVIIHMTNVRYLSLFTNLNRFERVQDGCFFICNRKVLLFLVFMSCQCHQNIYASSPQYVIFNWSNASSQTTNLELTDKRAGLVYVYEQQSETDSSGYYKCNMTRYISVTTATTVDYYDNIKYSAPLYFGDFWQSNRASGYTSYNKPYYNNFFWQANMGMKTRSGVNDDATTDPGYVNQRNSAVVSDLVYGYLSGSDDDNASGNLLDRTNYTATVTDGKTTYGGTELPYLSTSWADVAAHQSLVKYYNKDYDADNNKEYDLTFPFYETYSALNENTGTVKVKTTDANSSTNNERARFYQFDSREANLQFQMTDVGNHSGYFKESSTDIVRHWWDGNTYIDYTKSDRSNVGFYPFNSNNNGESGNTNKHNLGFGTKMSMDFQLEEDGCVSAVKLDDGSLKSLDTTTRIHTIFEFTGDDDLWVFIDGNLVLDMGGDHNKAHGIIDFADRTAKVEKSTQYGTNSSGTVGTSYDDLGAQLLATNYSQLSGDSFSNLLSGTNFSGDNAGKYDTKVTHTMTIFYMERGMLDSNLRIRYNYSPIENASKMKVAEVTKFDDVNEGFLALTKQAAEDDIFKYTVTNTGTTVGDPLDSKALYMPTALSTRTNTGWTTALNAYDASGTPAAQKYNPPTNTSTPSRVKNTAYMWVDKRADVDETVGLTTPGTTNDYTDGGDLWLMYGTDWDIYNKNKDDDRKAAEKESSAEFIKQFSKNSTMQIVQGENLYAIARNTSQSTHPGTLYNASGTIQAVEQDGQNGRPSRAVDDYYSTEYRAVDRNGNPVDVDSTTKEFTFNNRTETNVPAVTNPVSQHLAVQLTEYVENTVLTGTLTITNQIINKLSADEEFEYTITFTNVFGNSNVNGVDFSKLTAEKSMTSSSGARTITYNLKTTSTSALTTGVITTQGKFTLKDGQTGDYTIFVRYTCASKAGNIKVSVNGTAQTVRCEKTATNEWRLVSVKAALKAGQNTLIITNSGALPMYIDQIIYQPDDVPVMTYDVNVRTATHGTVTADRTEAAEGDTVTLRIEPAEGYKLKSLRVTNSVYFVFETTIPVPAGATEVKVVMPHDNMTIQPSFTEADGIYKLDFTNVQNGAFPEGWRATDNTVIHEYPQSFGSGGGTRTMTGFTGYQGKALYWRTTSADYGRQTGYPLILEPGGYKLEWAMAAWKETPKYKAHILEAASNEEIAVSGLFSATPNADGRSSANLSSATKRTLPFIIDKQGKYVIQFTNNNHPNMDEFLLLSCRIVKDATTGITTVDAAHSLPEGIYSPSGVRRQQLQRGLNIVVGSDGKSHKMMVK